MRRNTTERNDGSGQDGRWAVPIRRVFPWWFVGGAVLSLGALILLNPDGDFATAVFWGPLIGVTIRDREKLARTRLDQGLPVDRASLISPPWLEPVLTLLMTATAIGAGLLLSAVFRGATPGLVWEGAAFLLGGAVGFLGLITVLSIQRRQRRRRGTQAQT